MFLTARQPLHANELVHSYFSRKRCCKVIGQTCLATSCIVFNLSLGMFRDVVSSPEPPCKDQNIKLRATDVNIAVTFGRWFLKIVIETIYTYFSLFDNTVIWPSTASHLSSS